MEKRGLSHLEFVLSFVIFIGFILFAFVFFNPLQSNRTLKSTMDYAWIEVNDRTKEKVETYSVNLDSLQVSVPIVALDIPGISTSYNATVENSTGSIISSFCSNEIVSGQEVRRVAFNRNNDYFFRIRFSKALNNGPLISSPTLLTYNPQSTSQYYVSSSNVEEVYFENLFKQLNNTYFSDYNGLKTDLNLANRVDFGFVVNFKDSEIRALKEIPSDLEVVSKTDKIEVIRSSGAREYAELTVLAW